MATIITTTTTTEAFPTVRDAIRAWASAAGTNGAFEPEALNALAEKLDSGWGYYVTCQKILGLLAEAGQLADARHYTEAEEGGYTPGPPPKSASVHIGNGTLRVRWSTSVDVDLLVCLKTVEDGWHDLGAEVGIAWVEIHGEHEQRTDALRRVCRPLAVDFYTVTSEETRPDTFDAECLPAVDIINPRDIDV